MATTTRIIDANVNGTVYTASVNNALEALDTCHAGTTAPTDEVSDGKFWLDTSGTDFVLKIYRSGWKAIATISASETTLNAVNGTFTNSVTAVSGNFSGTVTAVDFNTTSDARLKSEIITISNATEKLEMLRGVEYIINDKPSIGVIAQEIEEVIPQVVNTDSEGYKSVAYGNIVGLLIEALKESNQKVSALEERVKLLEK